MEKEFNPRLFEFFEKHYRRAAICLVGTNDPVGKAIRDAQRGVTVDGSASRWSHAFIMGERRRDGRPQGNGISPYIFESDLEIHLLQPQIRNGAQESWIGKWCTSKVEYAAVLEVPISPKEEETVLATALRLASEQYAYPVLELIGTWSAIILRRQWRPNPVDDEHAMYCSAFVRYCYKEAGCDPLEGEPVDISNTTPEDLGKRLRGHIFNSQLNQ